MSRNEETEDKSRFHLSPTIRTNKREEKPNVNITFMKMMMTELQKNTNEKDELMTVFPREASKRP